MKITQRTVFFYHLSILFVTIIVCFFSCNNADKVDSLEKKITATDDSFYTVKLSSEKLLSAQDNQCLKDSILFFHKQNDSLRTRLFLVNYKVEKVKFYLNLCTKNSSQDKFLKGWIRRAVE